MKYFKLEEFTKTGTGLPNIPGQQERKNIEALVVNVLDPARAEFGAAVVVTSGYRSEAVNAKIGGAKTSQHTKGEAADVKCANNKKLFDILRKQARFDQLIWEYGDDAQPDWVHVSWSKSPRKMVLRAVKAGGQTQYINLK